MANCLLKRHFSRILPSFATAAVLSAAIAGVSPMGRTLKNDAVHPLDDGAKVNVLLFVRTDCPITNRYAPELKRLATEFSGHGVRFWLVYPDRSETNGDIDSHIQSYGFPGTPVRDPERSLERYAKATVAPEAAVFGKNGGLVYHGRIDDQWVRFGLSRPEATRHDLELAIRDALEGKAAEPSETKAVGCYLADLN
jgi:hypothetical protein